MKKTLTNKVLLISSLIISLLVVAGIFSQVKATPGVVPPALANKAFVSQTYVNKDIDQITNAQALKDSLISRTVLATPEVSKDFNLTAPKYIVNSGKTYKYEKTVKTNQDLVTGAFTNSQEWNISNPFVPDRALSVSNFVHVYKEVQNKTILREVYLNKEVAAAEDYKNAVLKDEKEQIKNVGENFDSLTAPMTLAKAGDLYKYKKSVKYVTANVTETPLTGGTDIAKTDTIAAEQTNVITVVHVYELLGKEEVEKTVSVEYEGGEYVQDGVSTRPTVSVHLKKETANGLELVETKNETGMVNFGNKPKYDQDGNEIKYVFEVEITGNNNYKVTKNNDTEFKLVYTSPKKVYNANITWVGGRLDRRQDPKVELLKDGVATGNIVTVPASAQTATFNDLDETDATGKKYEYTVQLTEEVRNHTIEYTPNVNNTDIKLTYVSPVITFEKQVIKNGGKATEAKVKLLKDGVEVPNTTKTVQMGATVSYPDLTATDENGNDFHYTIELVDQVDNYTVSKDKNENIVLTYVSPKVKLTVEKQWIDGENLVPESITAALRRQEGINLVEAYTFELKKSENWTKEVEVDETDFQGDKYEYHLAEKTKVENFTDVVKGLIITNVYRVPKQELTLTKIWNGGKTRENVTLELKKADGTKVDEKKTTKVDDNTYNAVFRNVDKTELNGNKINFKADEKETFENYVKSVNGLIVTNTYVSPKIDLAKNLKIEVPKDVLKKVTKNVQIQLMRNGAKFGETKIVNVDDFDQNGNYTLNFNQIDKTDFDGNDYTYEIKLAKDIKGYEPKEIKDGILLEKTIEKGTEEVSLEYRGGKVRPNVVVELLQDGKVIKTETITNNKLTFNVDLNNKFGHEYKYEVKVKNENEINKKHYDVELKTTENMTTVKLTYVVPKINFPVNVIWQGKGRNNPKVKLQLLRNGLPFGEIIELENTYNYEFNDLDETDFNGNPYEYKIAVIGEVEGFYYEITPNGKNVVFTRNDLKGKVLPYAGLKENMVMSYVVLAVLVAGFVYSNKAKRNMNKLENISDIRRNNLRNK